MAEKVKNENRLDIHYLGHSAWLVLGQNLAWLFDYGQVPERTGQGLCSGSFDLADLGSRQAFVFFSHLHKDHWHSPLAGQALARPDTKVFLGLSSAADLPAGPAGLIKMLPRTGFTARDLHVQASGSTDQGVSFLVQTGDLLFYHGGDLAAWDDTAVYTEGHRQEVDWLAGQLAGKQRPLLAFLPVATSDGYQEEALLAGIGYFLDRIRPFYVLPMHAHGFMHLYHSFASWLLSRPEKPALLLPERQGASFRLDLKDNMKHQA